MLIAIEGIDGSGKGTQARRLQEHLQSAGKSAALLSFPRYDHTTFGGAIGDYLNGRFGTLEQVHPLLASLLFAGDRFESKAVLREAIESHDVVVLDRYVASNIAHQGARCVDDERDRVVTFIRKLEFEINGLPEPDLTILLDLPVATASELVLKKNPRSYTEQSADLHESDRTYMESVRQVYRELAGQEANWRTVTVADERVRSIDEIADEIAGLFP